MMRKILIYLSLFITLFIQHNAYSSYTYNPFTDELDFYEPITFEELDGSPRVQPVLTVVVSNGTLTDSGGGTVTLNNGVSSYIEDSAYSVSWNGVSTIAPSKNAVYDKIEALPFVWQTSANVSSLITSSDTVSIGTSAAGGKLFIDGDADEIQLQVRGHSTQTSSIAVFENSAGTDVLTIANDGTVSTGSGNGSIDIGSTGVRLSSDGDGAITFLGLGNGSDEDLTINLDDTSNTATVTSSTSLSTINFSSIGLQESGVNVPTTTDVCKTIESPADADVFLVHRASKALTVNSTNCIVEAATSAVITWQECDSAGDNCSTIESMTCDVDGAADNGVDNASIDSGDWIRMDVGTVTGTVGHVTACFTAVDA